MATRFPSSGRNGREFHRVLHLPSLPHPFKLLFPDFAGYLGSQHRAKTSSVKGWKEVAEASTALTSPCSFEGDG